MRKVRPILPAIVLLCSILVLVGWWLRVREVVQVLPGAAPMQANTALCFLFLAIGFISERWRERTAWGVMTVSGLTLIQYGAGIDLGIDVLLADPFVTDSTPAPGRMAPNTALAFLFSAGAAMLRRTRHTLRHFFASISGALGMAAFAGYLLDITRAYDWAQSVTSMAVHTSACFVLIWIHKIRTLQATRDPGTAIHVASFATILGVVLVVPVVSRSSGFQAVIDLGGTDGFPARMHCGTAWTPELLTVFIGAEIAIAISYFAIGLTGAILALNQTHREWRLVGIFFAAFVLSCGVGHSLDALMFVFPAYRLLGAWHGVTAVISIVAAITVVLYLPRLLAWWTPAEIERRINRAGEGHGDG